MTTQVQKGLHLPRLTTTQRDALIPATTADSTAAVGLAVFNTDSKCYDVWNGKQWLSLCGSTGAPVITVQPRAFSWKETTGETTYTGVTSPTNPAPLASATISVTATGADSYQWYEVARTGKATVAAGTSNAATYTPVGSNLGMKQYYCVVSNAFGSVQSAIAKVAVGCGAMTMNGGWRTFMCYNLGATITGIADQLAYDKNLYFWGTVGAVPSTGYTGAAADSSVFGSLWQWGRISDGHQRRDSPNSLADGPMNGTYTVYGGYWAAGGSEQIRSDSTRFYGRFITAPNAPYDWSRNPSGRNEWLWALWRQGWNDPCINVTGVDGGNGVWRVPTQTEWSDIWRGGQSASNPSTSTAVNTANTWVWQAPGTTTNGVAGTAGGFLIKPDGVTTTLFLPAAGYRIFNNGQLYYPGGYGLYWSATAYGNFSFNLTFISGNVIPANFGNRAYGFSVRCVAEQ